MFPSFYCGPKKANHSCYSWLIHAGLASEGMIHPFQTQSHSRDGQEALNSVGFWRGLAIVTEVTTTNAHAATAIQERFPRDCGGCERAPTCAESYPLGLCLLRMLRSEKILK